MKCKHEWKPIKDGSLDKICLKCCKKAMQATMTMPLQADVAVSASQPIARKQIDMPFYNGEKAVNVKVYEDEMKRAIMKAVGIPGINMKIGS